MINEKQRKNKTLLNKEVRGSIFRLDFIALLLMLFYGYSLALLGTGYEYRVLPAGIIVIIILIAMLMSEIIITIIQSDKNNERNENDYNIFDEDDITGDNNIQEEDYNLYNDPDLQYKQKKENNVDINSKS